MRRGRAASDLDGVGDLHAGCLPGSWPGTVADPLSHLRRRRPTISPRSTPDDKSAAFFPVANPSTHPAADPATNYTADPATDSTPNHPATNCAPDVTANHRAAGAGHIVHPRTQRPGLLPVEQ